MTAKMGARIADSLAYTPTTRAKFLEVIQDAASARRGGAPADHAKDSSLVRGHKTLADDAFHLIADWYHFAL